MTCSQYAHPLRVHVHVCVMCACVRVRVYVCVCTSLGRTLHRFKAVKAVTPVGHVCVSVCVCGRNPIAHSVSCVCHVCVSVWHVCVSVCKCVQVCASVSEHSKE